MFPALKKRADINQGFRSAVRATTIKAVDQKLGVKHPYDHCSDAVSSLGADFQKTIHSTQSELVVAMHKHLDLQENYLQQQLEMQQHMLEMQRRQLVILETQETRVAARVTSPALTSKVANQNPAGERGPDAARTQIEKKTKRLPKMSPDMLPGFNCDPVIPAWQEHPPMEPNLCRSSTEEHDELASDELEDEALEIWKVCNGLHTVDSWVLNYREHPAGWAALLMIHGVPEVTSRLRSKVENFAIYSALFLSVSLPAAFDVPKALCEGLAEIDLECRIRTRLYAYSILAGIVSNTFSILLAMSFVNALNETARDSDVFRMFARGEGFKATVKCQYAFSLGLIFNAIAMVVCVQKWVGWDAVALLVGTTCVAGKIYGRASKLLYESASIVNYWRSELGGKPDPDDPYDIDIPVQVFKERADLAHHWKMEPNTRLTSVGKVETSRSE